MTTNLLAALGLSPGSIIAFVGAGGKTRAAWHLSGELLKLDRRVILAPTSHLLEPILPLDSTLYLASDPQPDRLIQLLERAARLIVAAGRDQSVDFATADELPPARPIKLRGLTPAVVDQLVSQLPNADWLIEADGSRRHLLKAPAKHEPPIPNCVKQVVIVASLEAIGLPLDESQVHRSEIFARLSNSTIGQPITADMIAQVLLHPEGGLKNVPTQARVSILLTQRDQHNLHASAEALTNQLIASGRIKRVAVASLGSAEPVVLMSRLARSIAAVILAAGGSSRFGDRSKQLLEWHGRTFVQIAADNALTAGLEPVIVVVGSRADQVRAALIDHKVIIVENRTWSQGQSTSLRAGLQALPPTVEAALFMPIDQPRLDPQIIHALIDAHASSGKPIVVAAVNGKRTTPTLFHRSLFAAMLAVEGDRGARDLIDADPGRVAKVEVDPQAVLEIDTPEEYDRLKASTAKGYPSI